MTEIKRPLDDHYVTPPEAIRALLAVESFNRKFGEKVWEPCAGTGELAEALRAEGLNVYASTIQPKEFYNKELSKIDCGVDFLKQNELPKNCTEIITNPPYGMLYGKKDAKTAEKIIRHAVFKLTPYKVAMLLPMQFLGGVGRKEGLFKEFPPTKFYQFSDRIKMYPAGIDAKGKNTPTHYFGWFIWQPYMFNFGQLPNFAGWLNSKEFV